MSIELRILNTIAPGWETEHRFHPTRKWRFDYANPSIMAAIEIEGGVWQNGRHTRGKGFIGDMEKYNAATALGWRLFRLLPGQTVSEPDYVKGLIEGHA